VTCLVITWPVQLLLIRAGAHTDLDAGPSVLVPLAVAGCGPSLAAIAVTAGLLGWGDVRRLLAQARSWRIHPGWYVLPLVLPTIILMAGDLLFAARTHEMPTDWRWIQLPPWPVAVAAFVPPLGEELGWRAFALPRLQRRTSALAAALIIGIVWGAWHLPLFLFPEMSLADFPFFFVQVVAASIIMTWLYNSTGGRLCITLVAHLMLNLNIVLYLPSPATGLRPIACAALVAGVVAGLVVLAGGHTLTGFRGLFSTLTRQYALHWLLSLLSLQRKHWVTSQVGARRTRARTRRARRRASTRAGVTSREGRRWLPVRPPCLAVKDRGRGCVAGVLVPFRIPPCPAAASGRPPPARATSISQRAWHSGPPPARRRSARERVWPTRISRFRLQRVRMW
jgi:membrane protease YdiL (CAAX protease family)